MYYIRNRDSKKINKKYLTEHKGVILRRYTGTIKYALSRGVPIYAKNGKLLYKPKGGK